MPNPKLLAVSPPDHYMLRNLESIRPQVDLFVSNRLEEIEQHGDAEILLYSGFGGVPPMREVWPRLTAVRWVHSLSAGVERVLTPELISSDVPVTNARGVFKRSLAEFAVLGVLYFSKHVRRLIASQNAHHWDNFFVDFAHNKTAGIVGYGEIGRECGMLLKAIGLKIYAMRRRPEKSADDPILDGAFAPADLHAMLAQCDVVVAAAPLTPETRHLLNEAAFAAMRKNAIVINVGRGPVIDEAALAQALASGVIAAAALDVFEVEPLSKDSPLWDMENVLISPHCTDRTRDPDWLDLTAQCFVRNFHRYVNHQELENIVDKHAGY